jgi:hypothetical protein
MGTRLACFISRWIEQHVGVGHPCSHVYRVRQDGAKQQVLDTPSMYPGCKFSFARLSLRLSIFYSLVSISRKSLLLSHKCSAQASGPYASLVPEKLIQQVRASDSRVA